MKANHKGGAFVAFTRYPLIEVPYKYNHFATE